MAAFTSFTESALKRYIVMFGKGELEGYSPIESGIENSNYFVSLNSEGFVEEYVLTIAEGLSFTEAPFFSKVVTHLYQYGLPVAAPQTTLDGMSSTIFCGKPAFLVPRLSGEHPLTPTVDQCFAIGRFLAGLHLALGEVKIARKNPFDPAWMKQAIQSYEAQLTPDTRSHFSQLAEVYNGMADHDLPRGLVHGDLFRDNALYESETLTGVIDFYHTCDDILAMDLAIVINDWCMMTDSPELSTSVIAGYESLRPLTGPENRGMQHLQQIAAARFALTRLASGNPPLKDPQDMIELGRQLRSLSNL